jgi:hypothetical protein
VLAYAYTDVNTADALLKRTVPHHLVSALASDRLGDGWVVGTALYVTGSLPAQDGIFGQSNLLPLGWMRRLDVHVGRDLRVGGVPLRVTVGAQSALGDSAEFRFNTIFSRRLFAEVAARF